MSSTVWEPQPVSDLYHGEYPVDMTPTEARAALAELQTTKPYVPRLKSCAHCGGRAEIIEKKWPYQRYCIRCAECRAMPYGWKRELADAETLWNIRA